MMIKAVWLLALVDVGSCFLRPPVTLTLRLPSKPSTCTLRCEFPSLARAGQARGLREGMLINEWEHQEEVRLSQGKHAFMRGAQAPNIRPQQQVHPLDMQNALDDMFKVSSAPLFTKEECQNIIEEAEEGGGGWIVGGRWHTEFPGIDLPVGNLARTNAWLDRKLPETILPFIAESLPDLCSDPSFLRLNDCFLVKYNAKAGQTSLRAHRDNSLISVNIALNPEWEYEGGGTWVEPFDNVVTLKQGHAMAHSSSIFHAGNPITGGTRYILVLFLITTEHTEHCRRFIQRGADLRNGGMLAGAQRSFENALAVLREGMVDDAVHEYFWSGLDKEVSAFIGMCSHLLIEHRTRLRLLILLNIHLALLKCKNGQHTEAQGHLRAAAVIAEGTGPDSLAPAAWTLLAGLMAAGGAVGDAEACLVHAAREGESEGKDEVDSLTGLSLEGWRGMLGGGGGGEGLGGGGGEGVMTAAWMETTCGRVGERVREQLQKETVRLEREAEMGGKMERYLRPVLCELFLEQGALLDREGAGANAVLASFEAAALCDPAAAAAAAACRVGRQQVAHEQAQRHQARPQRAQAPGWSHAAQQEPAAQGVAGLY